MKEEKSVEESLKDKSKWKEGAKNIEEIIEHGISLANNILKKKVETVVEATKTAKGWRLVIEVLERKTVPDLRDLLGRYEFELDPKGELLNFKQIMVRNRSDLKFED